jgi:hypothetical protein
VVPVAVAGAVGDGFDREGFVVAGVEDELAAGSERRRGGRAGPKTGVTASGPLKPA